MRRLAMIVVIALGMTASMTDVGRAADTTTTFTLSAAGGLGISAPAAKDLGTVATNAGTLSTQLGAVTVTDDRGALGATWTATAVATAFTTGGATADETIPAANVDYWSGAATGTTGVGVFTPGQLLAANKVTVDVAKTAFSMTGGVGNNSAAWDPTVVVTIPGDSVVGAYTGTITHSVA